MNPDYDVIVAGAGPAGATAALFARRAGLRVLLLDKRRFPRDKTCGDAIARKSIKILRELRLLDAIHAQTYEPIGSAIVFSPAGKSFRMDLTSPGSDAGNGTNGEPEMPFLVCRRAIFDNVLVDAAKQEMEVLEGQEVTGVITDAGDVCGITCRGQDGTARPLSAKVIIGADGYNSAVARKLGLYRFDSKRWFSATRAYYRGLDCPPNTVEIHFFNETLPGFLWIFPAGGGITNVGLGMIHTDIHKRGRPLLEVHEAIVGASRLRTRFQNAKILGRVRGSNLPTPDWRRVIHGNGFMLAGDAAGLVDPFSGEGVGNAMCSGRIAARVAAEACREKDFTADKLKEYPQSLWAELDKAELKLHYRLRHLARRRRLVNFLIGRAAAHPGVLEWMSSMMGDQDVLSKKRELVSPLTYIKLLLRAK